MLGLFLIVLLLALGMAAVFWAGSAVVQGYLYSEPAAGLWWRSAAAGASVGMFLGLWCLIESKWPGRYDTLFNFSSGEEKEFPRFWSLRKGGPGPEEEILFQRRHDERGRLHYMDRDNREWRRSDSGQVVAVIVDEDGAKKRFEAERNPDGTFLIRPNEPLRFVEVDGQHRVMTETAIGRVTSSQTGVLVGNLAWNLLHFLVWFLCLWLLLRYQWAHALGLALAFWLAMSLTIWPVLQERVKAATGSPTALQSSEKGRI